MKGTKLFIALILLWLTLSSFLHSYEIDYIKKDIAAIEEKQK